ncbi:MAG TPA: MG2 domain-containing protein, partial [Polyangiaceae bacterium]
GAESRVLEAELDAPVNTTQHELVNYVVRIEGESAPEDATAVHVTRSLLHVVPLYEIEFRGPKKVREGRPVSYRLRAQDALTREALAGIEIGVTVEQTGGTQLHTVETSSTGDAVVTLDALEPGDANVAAVARAHGTEAALVEAVTVAEDAPKLLLTTDKPLYQPGQTIHLRALGLDRDDNRPLAEAPVVFEVEDGKGNKVFKRQLETDAFGVASTKFVIGRVVNQGTYKVRALHGSSKTEKTVEVSRYALPKFGITLTTERPWYRPAEVIAGVIDARYFFGKHVSGQVVVEAFTMDVGLTPFQSVMGRLDENGRFDFELALPSTLAGLAVQQGNAAVVLRVTVTDSAGQSVTRDTTLPVASGPAKIALVPEASQIVPGIENSLLLFVTDPLGAPLGDVDVQIQAPGVTLEARTDEFGQAEIGWEAPTSVSDPSFVVTGTVGSEPISASFRFASQAGQEHLIVRTDKSVYEQGEEIAVEILSSTENGNVYVDWLNDGQAVDLRTLEVEDGRARFTMPVDTALLGDNRVEAYVVDSGGDVVRAGRTLFVRSNRALKVELTADKAQYAPGESAELTFSVKDESGEPAVAALGVQIVDEAVYGLIDAQPGLLRTYFELDDAFAEPRYEIHGPAADFSRLFFFDTLAQDENAARAAQRTSAGALAALGTRPLMGIAARSYEKVLGKAREQLAPAYATLIAGSKDRLQSAAQASLDALEKQGCTRSACQGEPFDARLKRELTDRFVVFDFWGQLLSIQSVSAWDGRVALAGRGPDEVDGTADDVALTAVFQVPSGGGLPVVGIPNAGAGGAAGAIPGQGNPGPILAPSGPSPEDPGVNEEGNGNASGPRVRSDFPETLYVNPSVITDESGTATVALTLADSITEWRVSTLASSADGKLGGGESGVTVFQDFFVDVNFPATLTRGDEISFPIAIYNYLDEPQTVTLELQPAAWYTPRGNTTLAVALEPGEVRGVSVPVRVEGVGLQKLTVVANGSERADAVARTVRVLPDGKRFAQAQSGSLATGNLALSAVFPENAVTGSGELYLDVYPAFLAQVVSGMDSMLQVPSGCFEQTTATAWPNVLVTDYMKQTNQITPEILLKAESLMSAGYQR